MKVRDVDEIIGDLVSDFERQRLKSDLESEREKKRIRDQRLHEKKERERMGASAWFEQNEERIKSKTKEDHLKQADSVARDVAERKEIREVRRIDRQDIDKRHDEYEKMQKQWKEEDERREKEKGLDEKRDREVVWARLDSKKTALTREREEWKKEREQREEKRAFDKEMREKRWQAEKERDHSVAQDLAKVEAKKQKEKMRYLHRHDVTPLSGIAADNDFHDLEANSQFRETFRSRGHVAARSRRLRENEEQMADLGRWYKNRDNDRAERHHQITLAIYS